MIQLSVVKTAISRSFSRGNIYSLRGNSTPISLTRMMFSNGIMSGSWKTGYWISRYFIP